MSRHGSIDRLEDDVAVLIVDGREVHRPRSDLPRGAREGDVIDLDTLTIDREATEALRRSVAAARARARKNRAPPGDL